MESVDVAVKADPDAGSRPRESSPTDATDKKKSTVRRRTKTGCLTCRRRRIKCDEGKPTCHNCIKSKRHCEGYNQRVVFKEPIGAFHGGPYGPIGFQVEPTPTTVSPPLPASQPKPTPPPGPLLVIAPKPSSVDFSPTHFNHSSGQARSGSTPSINLSPTSFAPQGLSPDASLPLPGPPISGPFIDFTEHGVLDYRSSSQGPSDPSPGDFSPPGLRQLSFSHAHVAAEPATSPDGLLAEIVLADEDEEEEEYWYSDDDASMADSEDETSLEGRAGHLEPNDLGILVASRLDEPQDAFGTDMRTFSTFANDNVLAAYVPSSANSPLNDSQTAAIFWYFVNVTGPSMSLYERHPFDPMPMFQGQSVPRANQHIWTYTFPVISLNHPALLQAILALGSLQMAKLQGVPATAAMKHYHLSLRRLAKNYQRAQRRVQPATLAATLLLGFYEVWNSDHDKWCKHMWGARAILKEIPLRDMTREIFALKRKRRQREQELRDQPQYNQFMPYNDVMDNGFEGISTALLAQLSGRPVNFDECGHVSDTSAWTPSKRYTEHDIETYENVRDLFWWYCKMDVYQSFLGGTSLLMDYEYWTQCPPRSPIGRLDAVFGTFDHLMLLLGRLASFASQDLIRKRRAKKMDGAAGGPPGQSPPGFAGMMPSKGHVTVPTGFSPPRETTPTNASSPEEFDLEASTAAALHEWESIRQAFEIFKARLGPDFRPMGPEYTPPLESPFGPALVYRTYSIAGIWLNFFMGLIVLYRAHPSMPPVAMIAAGMAAHQTGAYANELGRIAAGLSEDRSGVRAVSTITGAVFIESCFPLFVAGVQFQSTPQRNWTIKRLYDVARLTGWQSARQIAGGCEAGWIKAASVGRGPPYERPPDLVEEAPRSVWTRHRRIEERIRDLDDEDAKITLTKSERPQYALGLLSMEDEIRKLDLGDD